MFELLLRSRREDAATGATTSRAARMQKLDGNGSLCGPSGNNCAPGFSTISTLPPNLHGGGWIHADAASGALSSSGGGVRGGGDSSAPKWHVFSGTSPAAVKHLNGGWAGGKMKQFAHTGTQMPLRGSDGSFVGGSGGGFGSSATNSGDAKDAGILGSRGHVRSFSGFGKHSSSSIFSSSSSSSSSLVGGGGISDSSARDAMKSLGGSYGHPHNSLVGSQSGSVMKLNMGGGGGTLASALANSKAGGSGTGGSPAVIGGFGKAFDADAIYGGKGLGTFYVVGSQVRVAGWNNSTKHVAKDGWGQNNSSSSSNSVLSKMCTERSFSNVAGIVCSMPGGPYAPAPSTQSMGGVYHSV